jgi:peptidoglycan-N-acetylglucosamine deacetylase
MSIKTEKLLELLSIECETENSHILIKLMFDDEPIDIKWKIDLETAKQLKALIEPNKNYKYRLSFQSTAIPSKGINYSWITRTQGDKSDNIFFSCSNTYVDGLETMKACTNLKELARLSTFTVLSPFKRKSKKATRKSGSSRVLLKRARLSVAACVAIAFILVYSGQSYNYEPALAKKKVTIQKVDTHSPLTQRPIGNENAAVPKKDVKETPKPIPSFHINKLITSSVPEGSVALTFDDGPSKHTKEIADILKKNQAGGTFFFIGTNVEKYPEYVQYVHKNGFSIGNHSMTHPDLTELTIDQQQQEISKANQLIEKLTSEPVTLFRPPYEANNQSTINLMAADHLKMVLWDRDPRDWQTKNPEKILDYIKDNDASGTIILLHESQKVVDILPAIINYLKSQQLQIITLESGSPAHAE